LAFAVIAIHDRFTAGDGFVYATFYLVAFVWIGLAHPQDTSLRFLPLLAMAYAASLIDMGVTRSSLAVASAAYVLSSCVLVGETVAWVGVSLRRSELALADAEERFRGSFEHAPIGMALATCDGVPVRVNQSLEETHPEDWETNGAEIASLSNGQSDGYQLEKRYIHSDGREDEETDTVRWLRTSNELHRAIERNELELHYQPQVDLHTNTMGSKLSPAGVIPRRVCFFPVNSSRWPRTVS
jgi:PAS domain-containing protein